VGWQIKVVGRCQLPLSPDVRQIIHAKCLDDIEQLPLSTNPIRTTLLSPNFSGVPARTLILSRVEIR
jgi:hypothetical protein